MTLWHAQFQVKYIPTLSDTLLQVLCYRNEEAGENNKHKLVLGPLQVETFEARLLEQMIDELVGPIWRRYYTREMIG